MKEATCQEMIRFTALSDTVTDVASTSTAVNRRNQSNISDSSDVNSYGMPTPEYINQHMVKPVYTYLYAAIDDDPRRSSRVRVVLHI